MQKSGKEYDQAVQEAMASMKSDERKAKEKLIDQTADRIIELIKGKGLSCLDVERIVFLVKCRTSALPI